MKPARRHDLVFIGRAGWRSVLAAQSDLAAEPLVAYWAERGWPLIRRRPWPAEGAGVPLGLPLPPFAGKTRLSFLVAAQYVISVASPPSLEFACRAAPRTWLPQIERLEALARRHSIAVGVFGSLAWSALTGIDYLTDRSDLDILVQVDRTTDLQRLTADLAALDSAAPFRIDGELMRGDGAAVNWREFHSGAREILMKTDTGAALLESRLFAGGALQS